jgi:ubiquinone/menaquinone biosynthesis C-methylase UbiE
MLVELRSEFPIQKGRWQVVRTLVTRRRVLVLLVGAVFCAFCAAAPKKKQDSRDSWQQAARVVEDLGLKEGSRIADIGCGRGYFTYRLGKAVGATGKVYATEISEKLLKPVSDRVKKDKLTNIEPVLSDPTDTKLANESVDAALVVNVLHHVPKDQRAALVKDIVEAIRPGGYLFIVDWRLKAKVKHDIGRRIPRDDLLKLATDAGLKLDAEFYYLEHQVFLRLRKATAKK